MNPLYSAGPTPHPETVNADGQLQNDPLSPFPPLAEMEDFWITEPSHQPYKRSHKQQKSSE